MLTARKVDRTPTPRISKEQWKKRLCQWRESGLSIETFAEQKGIRAETLKWWRWRIVSEDRASEASMTPSSCVSPEYGAPTQPNEADSTPLSFIECKPAEISTTALPLEARPSANVATETSVAKISVVPPVNKVEITLTGGRHLCVSSECDPHWIAQLIKALEEPL